MVQRQFGQNDISIAGVIPTGMIKSGAVSIVDVGAGSSGTAILYSMTQVTMPGVAGVWNPVYSASGKGALRFLALSGFDTSSRSLALRVTIDGNVVIDIFGTTTNAAHTIIALGAIMSCCVSGGVTTSWVPLPEPDLIFEKSLLIEFKSSTTDANSARFAYRVIPR